MAESPKFALYVSSVEGRLVSRPGSPHSYIGAALRSPDEVKAGKTEPTWSTDVVVPIQEAEYLRYVREWDALTREGDLRKRTPEDFDAYSKALEATEKARDAELAKAAKDEADAKKAEADAKAKADAEAAKNKPKTAQQGGA